MGMKTGAQKLICPKCGDPTQDGLLCDHCTGQLETDLAQLPGLVDDLHVTLTRQSQTGTGNGGHGADRPVPFDVAASTTRRAIFDSLGEILAMFPPGTVYVRTDEPGVGLIKTPVPATESARCTWLSQHIDDIRRHPASRRIARKIERATERAAQTVDTPQPRIYCGPCPECGSQLFARPDQAEITCERCKDAGRNCIYTVADLRDDVLNTAAGKLIPFEDLVDALAMFAVYVPVKTLRTWRDRGRLVPHGDLYRIGDALTLAAQRKQPA